MEGSKDLLVLDYKIWEPFHGGKYGSTSVRYQRFGKPFSNTSRSLFPSMKGFPNICNLTLEDPYFPP